MTLDGCVVRTRVRSRACEDNVKRLITEMLNSMRVAGRSRHSPRQAATKPSQVPGLPSRLLLSRPLIVVELL